MANHVRIDRVTQGPDGQETRADRLSVNSADFMWLYVEAELPSGATPQGEYFKVTGSKPDPGTQQTLSSPTLVEGQYRFPLLHYVLSSKSKYSFHFADNLSTPHYEDRWEIVTL